MKNKILSAISLFALVFSALTPFTQVKALETTAASNSASPEGMLNPDGSLNLDGSFNGSLDLEGYSVSLDPSRGPVFGAAADEESSLKTAVATGHWAALGSGGPALNDHVSAIAVSGSTVYVGGYFTNADGLGVQGTGIVKWDGAQWSAMAPNTSISGSVNAIAVSGSNIYIGGEFYSLKVSGVEIPGAKQIAKWDGSHWTALGGDGAGGSSLNEDVLAISVSGSNVYVGGNFTDVNNKGTVLMEADYIAKWDTLTSNWSALGNDGSGGGSLNDKVRAIAIIGSNVYAGGEFFVVQNGSTHLPAASYIAKWDTLTSNWSALGGDNLGGPALNGPVKALAADGAGNLYAGGGFKDVEQGILTLIGADYVARWDGAWHSLGTGSGNGSLNGAVYALTVSGSNIYVSGAFTDVNNAGTVLTAADYVAQWNGAQWSALGDNGAGDGSVSKDNNSIVNALAVAANGNLFVGGNFPAVNNNGTPLDKAGFIARWDGTNWNALLGHTNGAFNNIGTIYSVAIKGADVYVGGSFLGVYDGDTYIPNADYVAKWDGAHWSALGSNGAGGGSLNNDVNSIAIIGSNVYVGGRFFDVNNNGTVLDGADYVAMWDGANWYPLNGDGISNGSIVGYVSALAASGTDLYVGGNFENVNNGGVVLNAADFIAKWDGNDWSALSQGAGGDGSLGSFVYAIATDDTGSVYVGGNFSDVNNNGTTLNAADFIAKWDGNNWSALGRDGVGNGALSNTVLKLAVSGSIVYAAGSFTDVNNKGLVLTAADNIAKFDAVTGNWSALGSNGAGEGVFANGSIYAIIARGTDLYVGGVFKDVTNSGTILPAADFIAKWDGMNWSAVSNNGASDGSFANSMVGRAEIYAFAASGNSLYVGGRFQDINDGGNVLPAADTIAVFGMSPIKAIIRSTGTQDGWILAKTSANAAGGTMNASATTLRIGDDAAKKQYRDTLSFTTQALPDNAVITKVTLRLKKSAITGGGDPITMFGGFMVDVKKGTFGTASLQLTDFGVAANKTVGPFNPALTGGWYSINLTAAKTFINKAASNGGLTQIRLRFKTATNNNTVANYLSLFSGNAGAASRPQLIVEYYVP